MLGGMHVRWEANLLGAGPVEVHVGQMPLARQTHRLVVSCQVGVARSDAWGAHLIMGGARWDACGLVARWVLLGGSC